MSLEFIERLPAEWAISKEGNKYRRSYALYKCSCCGNIVKRQTTHARNCNSCGCQQYRSGPTSPNYSHGFYKDPVYKVWHKMKERCYYVKDINYHNYGGRGISVCEDWLTHPKVFINWAYENGYKKGLQIDRINNDGNYEPSNCRFVTKLENSRNRSTSKLNKLQVRVIKRMIEDSRLSYREIAECFNVDQSMVGYIVTGKSWKDVGIKMPLDKDK